MSGWTKGPWICGGIDLDLEGYKITDIGGSQSHDGDGANEYIATVYDKSNALLVLAAPDLYAALDDLLRCMADCVFADKDPEMDVAEHNARAALARARGETP